MQQHIGFSDESNTRIETYRGERPIHHFITLGLHGSRVIGVLYGVPGTDCHAQICVQFIIVFAYLNGR